MRALIAIYLIAAVTFCAPAWADLLLGNPAINAFVMSDTFLLILAAGAVIAMALVLAVVIALFHPSRPAGRAWPEVRK